MATRDPWAKLIFSFFSCCWGYDYVKLAMFWPPGTCTASKCGYLPSNEFKLHGLWPSSLHSSPEFCPPLPNVKFPSYNELVKEWNHVLVDQLKKFTVPVNVKVQYSMWKHQWEKHGTCMLGQSFRDPTNQSSVPEPYFTDSVYAFSKYGSPLVQHLGE
ncbi:unnamed protein product [Lupinus luteus]|uniref:Uncharacterized protein n=1 Tax=Lupinus luteus TaxID=3873 RepID=A0AAV1YA40_LUPLU